MINDKKILAIIPARGGSKGLPGKNIKDLCGKPLIFWSIDAAKSSKYIDEIIISTDDNEIVSVLQERGIQVPWIRPSYLASDEAKSIDVIIHALEKSLNGPHDILVLLEPTSPLRDCDDIDKAIEMLESNNEATSIVGVCKTEDSNPAFLVNIKNGFITSYLDDYTVKRRQDIEPVYFYEGSVYASYSDELIKKKSFYHSNTIPYEVPKWKSLEIDDIYDFIMVEAIMKKIEEINKESI